ncbi:hypothetical protein [uncultured Bartonella sp.]|uniref:hypothetical protein n=1 Tax=uncultured Bartonella sp. TaxID=104108 RepID=UPI0025DB94A9|nr:hypothetical protein [uncultured Bartonella sp.]
MPSNTNTDKQNDNLEQASKADKKFIAFKKRMFWLGIGFLIAAIALSLPNYFACEKGDNIVGAVIFLFVVAADIFILLPAIITKETNWLALLGSTILCIVFLCLSVFYPFQDFQYRLKVISLVTIVATLLFVALNSWINAAFFPSKNADIRQSVDFASNRFAVDVLNVTLILGTLFGTIAFLYFYPGQDNSTFFGGIDIKNVALATAGLVTFFWAAKATKNKSIELEEKKQDGKRHDNEIAMAKQRDTAQLIAEASKLLSSQNDTQKYAGLSFLNRIASDSEGTFRKEAFDILTDFIMDASDVTTANKVRMRAIHYADDLVGNNPDKFQINEFIQISSQHNGQDRLKSIEIKNLYAVYIGFIIVSSLFQKEDKLKRPNQFAFIECIFDGAKGYFLNRRSGSIMVNAEGANTLELTNISVWNCEINFCKIGQLNVSHLVQIEESSTNKVRILDYVPDKYRSIDCPQVSTFHVCDFSDCLSWNLLFFSERNFGKKKIFENCYYHSGHEPNGFVEKEERGLLTKITSKKQFGEFFMTKYMEYYQREINKGKKSRIPKNKWFCD